VPSPAFEPLCPGARVPSGFLWKSISAPPGASIYLPGNLRFLSRSGARCLQDALWDQAFEEPASPKHERAGFVGRRCSRPTRRRPCGASRANHSGIFKRWERTPALDSSLRNWSVAPHPRTGRSPSHRVCRRGRPNPLGALAASRHHRPHRPATLPFFGTVPRDVATGALGFRTLLSGAAGNGGHKACQEKATQQSPDK
jgi:hypothetical protein